MLITRKHNGKSLFVTLVGKNLGANTVSPMVSEMFLPSPMHDGERKSFAGLLYNKKHSLEEFSESIVSIFNIHFEDGKFH